LDKERHHLVEENGKLKKQMEKEKQDLDKVIKDL